MVPTETKNLHWKDAWFHLLNGKKIKRPLWEGYWKWENNGFCYWAERRTDE